MTTMTKATQPKKDTSPRAAGPAGPQFEARVGAHYALGLLAQTEVFKLPDAIIDRVEFQRGGQGHPLDGIIVKATTRSGEQPDAVRCRPCSATAPSHSGASSPGGAASRVMKKSCTRGLRAARSHQVDRIAVPVASKACAMRASR